MKINRIKEIKELIVLIIIAFTVKTCLIEIYVVPTGSMEKTILIGDMLFGNKFIYGMKTPTWIGIPYTRIGFDIPWYRFPKFKNKNGIFLNKGLIINYNKTRFNKILNRCKKYLPYLKHAKYIGSFYVIRTIKTGVENTDQRTSEIINHNKKIISVMSGKWNNCVSLAKIIYKILG